MSTVHKDYGPEMHRPSPWTLRPIKMRSIQLKILTAVAMLSLVATHHLAAQKNATVGVVDFDGRRQITEAQVRQALRIVEGDLTAAARTGSHATIIDAALKRLEAR